jgi:hypothetical protein
MRWHLGRAVIFEQVGKAASLRERVGGTGTESYTTKQPPYAKHSVPPIIGLQVLGCKSSTSPLHSNLDRMPRYGQVSFAVPLTAIDMAPGPAEFADAMAITSTVPVAPATHCAKPDCEMVARWRSDTVQLPEYGATNVTTSGDGGLLKVPEALNCTLPSGELAAFATAGLTVID